MNRDNIVLIGMPGVGKSTVGVVLAKALGYQFVDADLLIQEAEGKLLSELIEEHGTDGFIEIENRVNSQIQTHRSVIATGGSVVYGKEAMEHLKSIGTVVYLKQNLRVLQRRLRNLKRDRLWLIFIKKEPFCMKNMQISPLISINRASSRH